MVYGLQTVYSGKKSIFSLADKYYWTLGLAEGVLSNRPCPLVRGQSVSPSVVRP